MVTRTKGHIWKRIEGFNDYMISNDGLVKSFKHKEEIILKPLKSKKDNPYLKVRLYKEGGYYPKPIHRLVALHFIPKIEGKNVVNHKDSNPSNNNRSNLEWVTTQENVLHAISKNRHFIPRGEEKSSSKLTNNKVRLIRRYFSEGTSKNQLAQWFGVSNTTIRRVINKTHWRHV